MTPENKKYISEAIKNIVIALALCIGGLWTYITFDARLEAQNAKAQLQKLENDLIRRWILESRMEVTVKKDETRKSWLIITDVKIKNKGNIETEVGLVRDSFRVAKVVITNGVVSEYINRTYAEVRSIPDEDEANITFNRIGSITLLPGKEKHLQYVVEVKEPGFYQLEFVGIPNQKMVESREKDEFKGDGLIVGTREFIQIKLGPNK